MQIYIEYLGINAFKNDKYIMELIGDRQFRVRNISEDFLAAIFLSILEIQNKNNIQDFLKNCFTRSRNDSEVKNLLFFKIFDLYYKSNDIQQFYGYLKQQNIKSSEIKKVFHKYIMDRYNIDSKKQQQIGDFREILLKLSKQCSVKFQIIQWDGQQIEYDDVEKGKQKLLILICKSQSQFYYLVTNITGPLKLTNQKAYNLKQNKDQQEKFYHVEDTYQNKQYNQLNSIQNSQKHCIICQDTNPQYNSIKCKHSYCIKCFPNRFRYWDRFKCDCSSFANEIQYFGIDQIQPTNSNKMDKVPFKVQYDQVRKESVIQEEYNNTQLPNYCQKCQKQYDNSQNLFQQECGHKICMICWRDFQQSSKEVKLNCPKIYPSLCLNKFNAQDIDKFYKKINDERQVNKNGVSPSNGIKIDQSVLNKNLVQSKQIDNNTKLCYSCNAHQEVELMLNLKCKHSICFQCLEKYSFINHTKMYCRKCYEIIDSDLVKDFYQKFNNSIITPGVEAPPEDIQYKNCNLCIKNKLSDQVYINTICSHTYCISCILRVGLSNNCYLRYCQKQVDYGKLEEYYFSQMTKQTKSNIQLKQEQLVCSQCQKKNTVEYEKELEYFKCTSCNFLNCYKHLIDKKECFCFCNKCCRKTVENEKNKNMKLCEKCVVYYCSACGKSLSIEHHRSTESFEQQFLRHKCKEQIQEECQNFTDKEKQTSEINIKQSIIEIKQQNSQCPLKCTDECNCQNQLCSQCLTNLKNQSLMNRCKKHCICFCCEISQSNDQNCIFCKNQIKKSNITEVMPQFFVQHVLDKSELPAKILDSRINNYLEPTKVQTRGYSAAKPSQFQNNQHITSSSYNYNNLYNFNNYYNNGLSHKF